MQPAPLKLRVAVLYGGRSSERDISLMSATNVIQAIDRERYDVVPIYVTTRGTWLLSDVSDGQLAVPSHGTEICLLPGGEGRTLTTDGRLLEEGLRIDVLLPMLHGLHGEDGAVQGLAEVARVPLAGCGILGSATALDKDIAKRLLRSANLPVARSITLERPDDPRIGNLTEIIGLPLFVKPARQGSSVGVSRVTTIEQLMPAIAEAFKHDSKILVEELIRGRELECSVLESATGSLIVSRPGEIAPTEDHGYYSFDAKYVDPNGAVLTIPANVPSQIEANLRSAAAEAFVALGCNGMARVDFFLTADWRFLINEVNTIPGFTNISMYPKALVESGISQKEILTTLIEHGLARTKRDAALEARA